MSTKCSMYYFDTANGYVHIYYEMYEGAYYIDAKHPKTGEQRKQRVPKFIATFFVWLCKRYLGLPK